jgi:hypothetical protein
MKCSLSAAQRSSIQPPVRSFEAATAAPVRDLVCSVRVRVLVRSAGMQRRSPVLLCAPGVQGWEQGSRQRRTPCRAGLRDAPATRTRCARRMADARSGERRAQAAAPWASPLLHSARGGHAAAAAAGVGAAAPAAAQQHIILGAQQLGRGGHTQAAARLMPAQQLPVPPCTTSVPAPAPACVSSRLRPLDSPLPANPP